MEEKRKRRRRRKPMTEKNNKKHEKNHARLEFIFYQEKHMTKIKSVPDIRTVMKDGALTNLLVKYGFMTPSELLEKSKDPKTSCFERMQMERMAAATTPKTKIQAAIGESVINRIEGKPKDRVEHSGPNGDPITLASVQARDAAEWERVVENMNAEEFEEYKRVVDFNKQMKSKYADNK